MSTRSKGPKKAAEDACVEVDIPYRRCNTLRLEGITKDDYKSPELLADTRFLTGVDEEEGAAPPSTVQTHEKLPAVFTGLEDWPLGTTLCCHECGLTFAGRPKFIPTFVRESANVSGAGRLEMGVRGAYCSWACAELWIETRYIHSTEQRWRLQDSLRHAFRAFTGRRVSQIRAALPREDLVQYGGELELAAWLRRNRELEPEGTEASLSALAAGPVWLNWGNAWRASPAGEDFGYDLDSAAQATQPVPAQMRPDNVSAAAFDVYERAALVDVAAKAPAAKAPAVAPTASPLLGDDDLDRLLSELD